MSKIKTLLRGLAARTQDEWSAALFDRRLHAITPVRVLGQGCLFQLSGVCGYELCLHHFSERMVSIQIAGEVESEQQLGPGR